MDTLYFLDQLRGAILSCNTDGTGIRTVLADCPRHPDGIAIDEESGHIYWTNMGRDFKQRDGSIERCRLDGSERRTIVAEGRTFTPKQLVIDKSSGHLYWCDREGMRVMRCTLDGEHIEVLVQTGEGEEDRLDARNWCVGIAIDQERSMLYWTQKGPPNGGAGRILRAPLALPRGVSPAGRTDIEVLFEHLPEPVDLKFAPDGTLYWTDRALSPYGGSVNRAAPTQRVLSTDLGAAIGIAISRQAGKLFVGTLQGSIYSMNLDGSGKREFVHGVGRLTGICYHRGHE